MSRSVGPKRCSGIEEDTKMKTYQIKRDMNDKLFSDYIRSRDEWTCQRCGKYFEEGNRRTLHCCHLLYGRGIKILRFNELQCYAMCYFCHGWLTSHPGVAFKFLLNRIDLVAFNVLNDMYEQRETYTYDKEKKSRVNKILKQKIEQLNG